DLSYFYVLLEVSNVRKGRVKHMDEQNITLVAKEVGTKPTIVEKVIDLLKEGNTVPFIARYRKEVTNGLDEIQIKSIQDKWTYAENLRERKEEVLRLIE